MTERNALIQPDRGQKATAIHICDKAGLDAKKAVALMVAQPSMIKRPVLAVDGKLTVGFKPEVYADLFR